MIDICGDPPCSSRNQEGSEMKNKVILWGVLLAAGFLIGFIPQFRARIQLETKLAQANSEFEAARLSSRQNALRDSISLAYLEATRKNYGTAAEHASSFFNQVRDLSTQPDAESLRQALQSWLESRDALTAALARGDASAIDLLQELLLKTFRATGVLPG